MCEVPLNDWILNADIFFTYGMVLVLSEFKVCVRYILGTLF